MNLSGDRALIIGGGEIGYHALKFFKKNKFSVIIVDSHPYCKVSSEVDVLEMNHDFDKIKQIQAGKSILFTINENLNELPSLIQRYEFKYIIPAIPVHAMAKLTYAYLDQKDIEARPAPDLIKLVKKRIAPSLIHCYNEQDGIIVASFMPSGQNCSPNCHESMKCPVTGITKPKPLYELFKDACAGFPARILVSEQLEPNLGGISGSSVKELFKFLNLSNDQMTIGTSCICHGIINAIELQTS